MGISGDRPDHILYQRELQEGVKLFEAGFKGLQESKFEAQKLEYEKSMSESFQVIQDTTAALMNQKLMQLKDELSEDYQNYLANPSQDNRDKIQQDIDSLKKSVEEH